VSECFASPFACDYDLSRLKKIQGKKNDAKAVDDAKRAAAKEAGIAAGRCFTEWHLSCFVRLLGLTTESM
jgi:hypothetical protein